MARHAGRDAARELLGAGLAVAVLAAQRGMHAEVGQASAGVGVLRADLMPADLGVALLAPGARVAAVRVGVAGAAGGGRAAEVAQVVAAGARHRPVLAEEAERRLVVVEPHGAPVGGGVAVGAGPPVEADVRVGGGGALGGGRPRPREQAEHEEEGCRAVASHERLRVGGAGAWQSSQRCGSGANRTKGGWPSGRWHAAQRTSMCAPSRGQSVSR